MNRLSLRLKLVLSFLFLAALLGGVNYYQVHSLQKVRVLFSDLIDHDMRRVEALREIKVIGTQIRSAALEEHEASPAAIRQKQLEIDNKMTAAELQIMQYNDNLRLDDSQQNYGLSENVEELLAELTTRSKDLVKATTPGDRTARMGMLETTRLEFLKTVDLTIVEETAAINREKEDAAADVRRAEHTAVIISLLTAGMAILLGLLLARYMTGAFKRLRAGADRIANGDFSRPITIASHDELGQLAHTFNEMSTRLRDSYRRLALEKQRDDTLLESMGEGLVAIDEKGDIVLINSNATELLELGQDILPGQPVVDLFTVLDNEDKPLLSAQRPELQAMHESRQVTGVFGFRRNDKKKILISVSASPVVLEGQVAGAIMVLRDVTKEREIDRMKTEFISLASHQLRTPLSAIKWFSEMLISGDAGRLNMEQTEFAANISDSTQRMIELVNSLLNISRIESGRIIVDPRPTKLKDLVQGIVNDLKVKTEERQQTLIVSVHEDLPQINLDPRLISQVYLNLLTNAIKYTPKGGEISVMISKKGDQVVSQVADNGYGIPKEEQGKLFQKFFRAENIVKVETDGTGLGLYLIKAIVESSGGKIWYESEENKGTTFWFSLPLSGMKPKEGEVTLDM